MFMELATGGVGIAVLGWVIRMETQAATNKKGLEAHVASDADARQVLYSRLDRIENKLDRVIEGHQPAHAVRPQWNESAGYPGME